jgi:hypothetical protein
MNERIFDHDRLDVRRLSIEYVATSLAAAKDLNGCQCHARDQWLSDAVAEPSADYNAGAEYEYRDAE